MHKLSPRLCFSVGRGSKRDEFLSAVAYYPQAEEGEKITAYYFSHFYRYLFKHGWFGQKSSTKSRNCQIHIQLYCTANYVKTYL